MSSSSVSKQVNIKMRSIIQLARECIVDKLNEEIKKAGDDEELRNALIKKQNDVLELEMEYNDNTFIKIKTMYKQPVKIPSEPVIVRGTPLKLMNMTNNMAYRKLCANVAALMGFQPDFSDAPFNNLVKNTRVYEAIRRGYKAGRIDQDFLDQLVNEAEEEASKLE